MQNRPPSPNRRGGAVAALGQGIIVMSAGSLCDLSIGWSQEGLLDAPSGGFYRVAP